MCLIIIVAIFVTVAIIFFPSKRKNFDNRFDGETPDENEPNEHSYH